MPLTVPGASVLRMHSCSGEIVLFTLAEAEVDTTTDQEIPVLVEDPATTGPLLGTVEICTDAGVLLAYGSLDVTTGTLSLRPTDTAVLLDRRKEPRLDLCVPVFGTAEPDSGPWPRRRLRLEGETLDISTTGLLVRAHPVGEVRFHTTLCNVFLEVALPTETVAVYLTVTEQRGDLLRGHLSHATADLGPLLRAATP